MKVWIIFSAIVLYVSSFGCALETELREGKDEHFASIGAGSNAAFAEESHLIDLYNAQGDLTNFPLAFTECDGSINDSESSFVDDTSPILTYSSPWKAETPGLGLYQGTQHITHVGGNKVSHTFNTPGGWSSTISYGYRKMRNAGKAAIYWDGQYFGTISLYNPDNVYHCELTFHDMPSGVHTVMVKVLNQKEPASSGTYVNIDYFRQYDF